MTDQEKTHSDRLEWAKKNAKPGEAFELFNCPHCNGHLVIYTLQDTPSVALPPIPEGPPDLL